MTDQELAVWYNDHVIYPDKVRLNKYYLDHYSFIKDIQMIVCTVLGKKLGMRGKRFNDDVLKTLWEQATKGRANLNDNGIREIKE